MERSRIRIHDRALRDKLWMVWPGDGEARDNLIVKTVEKTGQLIVNLERPSGSLEVLYVEVQRMHGFVTSTVSFLV